MYVLYYVSMLQCCHLVWILVSTDHPCLGVGCHNTLLNMHGIDGMTNLKLFSIG
jgi:hypothetical protein